MKSLTTDIYKARVKAIHGDNVIVLGKYTGMKEQVKHQCSNGHVWTNTPNATLNNRAGCRECAHQRNVKKLAKPVSQYKRELKEATAGTLRLIGEYVNGNTPHLHKCMLCGESCMMYPINILNRQSRGCAKCNRFKSYSKIALQWLAKRARADKCRIRHAENGGELQITLPTGRRVRVDGFCVRTNTVYEFYGDAYHGNPKVFESNSKPNPFSDKTAKELYRATLIREKELLKAGYNVVSIWQKEFLSGMI